MNVTANLNRSFVPSKSLENPQSRKPIWAGDQALAVELQSILNALPIDLQPVVGRRFPLLTALRRHRPAGAVAARRLVFVAAQIHQWSDERRTAEYLLRHRDELADGRRTATALVSAARCAAEMDSRRARVREVPVEPEAFSRRYLEPPVARIEDASAADTVAAYLRQVVGADVAGPVAWGRLCDAVTVAVELATQLANHSAAGIRAMRSDARSGARLSCRLVEEFGDRHAARSLARLLVGGDGTPVETALLWWVAHRHADPGDIPDRVRVRWMRDLMDADPTLTTSRTRRRSKATGGQCVRIRPGVS